MTSDVPYVCRYAALEDLRRIRASTAECRLTSRERRVYDGLGDARRREQWMAGRLLAKRLLLEQLAWHRIGVPPAGYRQIEIDSGQAGGRRYPPRVQVAGELIPWSLSISHTRRGVLVALATGRGTRIGVDLVEPAAYGEGFASLWFTPAEQRWLQRHDGGHWTATLWAAKEAVYKAASRGESFAPRRIEILPDPVRGLICAQYHQDNREALTFQAIATPQGEIAVIANIQML